MGEGGAEQHADLPEGAEAWGTKGLRSSGSVPDAARVGARLTPGEVTTPVAVVRDAAMTSNLGLMAEYCDVRGVHLAPHAKTTMAPGLLRRQLDRGAWGLTAATPGQAQLLDAVGAPRIVLANELVDQTAIRWLYQEVLPSPRRLIHFVDDRRQIDLAVDVLAGAPDLGLLDVLVEVGHQGGRTGCRSDQDVDAVVQAVLASPRHRLVGVSAYEGTIGMTGSTAEAVAVRRFLDRVRDTAERIAGCGWLEVESPILSAGGSAYFDVAADALAGPLSDSRPPTVVLRPGAYVTHDDGVYDRVGPGTHGSLVHARALVAAVEVWTRVLSAPEPGLALVDAGRRDLPFDAGLPVVHRVLRQGRDVSAGSGRHCEMTGLNDHHGYIRSTGFDLAPGDTLILGISHPCTLFDKWRWLPVVDDEGMVVDVLRTCL